MQRTTYGRSPPLHHPVPQHVSTVPQLRSPPPPASQSGYDGSPYQQQQHHHHHHHHQPPPPSGPTMFGQYGNFMNDPTAQLASQFGQTAFRQGQEYLEQNVSRNHHYNHQPQHPFLPCRAANSLLAASARTC